METDAEIMRRYRRGDVRAFEEIYRRHGARLFGFLLRLARCRDRARDVFQETFLRVHRARAAYDPSRRFDAWLYTLALNAWRDSLRREALRRVAPLDEAREYAAAVRPEIRLDVERALAALPEESRLAVLLCKHGGLTYDEAAAALGTTEGAVRMRLCRALQALRAALVGDAPEGIEERPAADA